MGEWRERNRERGDTEERGGDKDRGDTGIETGREMGKGERGREIPRSGGGGEGIKADKNTGIETRRERGGDRRRDRQKCREEWGGGGRGGRRIEPGE